MMCAHFRTLHVAATKLRVMVMAKYVAAMPFGEAGL
ncbi:hypothetical protein FHR87_001041 [Azomonas macrocytogenes]|uniref:Uncharacterized protein n=1 Tax=Azomonas macrocytogenes TaxID=69962 RepID=A0A839T0K3_AZOMA|nr:hypothetical protein [Azomonas macrocytogenes]